jgi:general secretion pathway protein L
MSRTRLVLLARTAEQPSPFLIVGADGRVEGRGVMTVGDPAPAEEMRTVAVVPGADVLVRWLDLPGRSDAQGRAAAAFLLRDELAVEPDRVAIGLGPATDGERLVAVANSALVAAWSDHVEALGLVPDVLQPDSLVPPEPEGEGVTVMDFGDAWAIRGRRFAASAEPDLAPLLIGERAAERLDPQAIEDALVRAALAPAVNLLPERRAAAGGSWKRAAVLALAVLLSPLAVAAAQAGRAEIEARRIEDRGETAVRRAFPDMAATADPAAEVKRRLGAAPPPGGAMAGAAVLFGAVEQVQGAEVDMLLVDPDGRLRATVTYPDASGLEALKTAARANGADLTDQSTVEDQGRIVSEITVGGAA